MVNSVGSIQTQLASETNSSRRPNVLDKDAFLKLLVAQLTHQDPLNPTDNNQFMAQLTNFGILEQITILNEGLEKLFSLMVHQQAAFLIGREVRVLDDQGKPLVGIVQAVSWSQDNPQLKIGENLYPLDRVVEVLS